MIELLNLNDLTMEHKILWVKSLCYTMAIEIAQAAVTDQQ